jgi:hypothetical protein
MAGQHAGTDVGRPPRVFQCRNYLFRHRLGDAIAVIGPPHRDDLDMPSPLDRDLRCCHVSLPVGPNAFGCSRNSR